MLKAWPKRAVMSLSSLSSVGCEPSSAADEKSTDSTPSELFCSDSETAVRTSREIEEWQ